MSKKTRRQKLVFDDSPPNEAQKKIEAEIIAFRAVAERMKPWIKFEVERAVKEAVKELQATGSAK